MMKAEILSHASLKSYLEENKLIGRREKYKMASLNGGVSNETILLVRANGDQWVIKQALEKLKVKEDWFSSTERLGIEYKGMEWLTKVLPSGSVPQPVFFDADANILIMEAIRQPFFNLKGLFLGGKFEKEWLAGMGKLLASIHTKGRDSGEAKGLFGNRDFFKNLRLEPYYLFTSERLPETKSFFQKLVEATLEVTETVVHGDYSPKNILLKDEKLILLDHEVMHYGDPAFDVGFCLCHILSNANFVADRRTEFIAGAHLFWDNYAKGYSNAKRNEKRAVHHTIGNLLARIKGRSPLNYLDESSGHRQLQIGLELITKNISGIPELIELFSSRLKKL